MYGMRHISPYLCVTYIVLGVYRPSPAAASRSLCGPHRLHDGGVYLHPTITERQRQRQIGQGREETHRSSQRDNHRRQVRSG